MATIDLTIAGRRHELACRDGEEAHLRAIAAMVDVKALDAARSMGGMSEARQMLFAALMLADELDEARARLAERAAAPPPPPAEPGPATAALIERLAERVERLSALVDAPASADSNPPRVETPAASA
jgi:cell division protein ZapA